MRSNLSQSTLVVPAKVDLRDGADQAHFSGVFLERTAAELRNKALREVPNWNGPVPG